MTESRGIRGYRRRSLKPVKQPPATAHWAIRCIYSEAARQGLSLFDIAERSGVLLATLKSWRTHWNVAPSLDSLERVFPVLGVALAVVPLPPIAADDLADQ